MHCVKIEIRLNASRLGAIELPTESFETGRSTVNNLNLLFSEHGTPVADPELNRLCRIIADFMRYILPNTDPDAQITLTAHLVSYAD